MTSSFELADIHRILTVIDLDDDEPFAAGEDNASGVGHDAADDNASGVSHDAGDDNSSGADIDAGAGNAANLEDAENGIAGGEEGGEAGEGTADGAPVWWRRFIVCSELRPQAVAGFLVGIVLVLVVYIPGLYPPLKVGCAAAAPPVANYIAAKKDRWWLFYIAVLTFVGGFVAKKDT
ncbi:hypothetical protein A1Q2_00030 [Trichosporon asahii var. asahii CBS 8904]|uniref:Uncharacterized protein n=1 Tax=Trichosporon asahii var. asahii (strain CBS 8904) TaxID=1220162 RepID=K1VNA7_TRIAC|nr:hypothetical protein A1Q2_00030 [Trichosporon asahii var. asahii CBS 8904]